MRGIRGIKLLIIALCIFKAISAAPAPQSATPETTTTETTTPTTTPETTTSTTTLETTTPTTTPETTTPETTTPETTTPETAVPPSNSTTSVPQSNSPNLNLPISVNGTCGPTFGTRCPDGTCCSGAGNCGETTAHCQAGCQPEYGVCGLPDSIRNIGFQFNTCTEQNTIAFTFDDGPHNITDTLLDHLKERNLKATFFMNGHGLPEHCIYDYAKIVQRAYKEGHQIASHTWSHPHLPKVSEEEVRYQIEKLEVAFKKIIGAVPTYLRPPFGERSELVQQILREKGYKMIIWDLDPNDWKGDLQNSINLYTSQINASPQPNPHIILNHDREDMTSTVFAPFEIDDTLQRGYKLTTVGGCIGKDKDDWYKDVGEPEERDDTWKCTLEDMHGHQIEL